MSTQPFGAFGFGFPPSATPDWEPLMRQWMSAFDPAAASRPTDPFAAWRQPAPAPAAGFDPSTLATQWLGQVQQLAAGFTGRDAQPADIARAWRGLLGENPFGSAGAAAAFMPAALFGGTGPGRGPFEMPAFGHSREHQERAQRFAKTMAEFQHASQAFQALVSEAGQDAFSRFESLLSTRRDEGKSIDSARALFDLWVDAAEDAYADIALGERFQKAFGEYVNAQMRVRAAMQKEVELACAQWGIPGRSEVDAAHRRISELERDLARMKRAAAPVRDSTAAPESPAPRARDAAPEAAGGRHRRDKVASPAGSPKAATKKPMKPSTRDARKPR